MKVKLFGSPALRKPATPVLPGEFGTIELNQLIENMKETMYQEEGIGLASNQIGHEWSVCVIDSSEPDKEGKRNQARVFINPKITDATVESVLVEESCLSIPGVFAVTERFKSITVTYNNVDGHEIVEEMNGIDAIAMQHEVDHLEGKLYVDKFGPVKKGQLIKKSQKFSKMKERGQI